MQELNLALALTRNRTVTTYGHSHYCKCHDTLVDYEHINNCNLSKPSKGLINDIVKVIENKKTIWDLETDVLKNLKQELKEPNKKI